MQYDHTQAAPLYLILVFVGVLTLVAASLIPHPIVRITVLGSGVMSLLLAFCFRHLRVCDRGDHLLVVFGPLPLFRRRIPFAGIERAEKTRSTIMDGWGIHLSPSGGWTWNIWGFDCVDVFFKDGRKIRIGTDDAVQLASFLKDHISVDHSNQAP